MIPVRISLFSLILLCGCDREYAGGSRTQIVIEQSSVSQPQTTSPPESNYFELAQQLIASGDYDRAAEATQKALIQTPENDAARLLAAKIEVARGHKDLASEIVAAMEIESSVGIAAVDLRVKLLVDATEISEAADVLLAGLQKKSNQVSWRHQAWKLLNQVGRREEASTLAAALVRDGLASEHEMLSLISQALSFPTPEMMPEVDAEVFAPGSGKARWYFSLGQFNLGIAELSKQRTQGFRDPATAALYGRLLAENQRWEEFREWSSSLPEESRRFSDYWAAVGTYFSDNRQYEAAARGLLEAVQRNPTDRLSVQRLFSVLTALDREEDGSQFRNLGIELALTEREAQTLYRSPGDLAARKRLVHQLMELGRPFETLAWTQTLLPPGADQQRLAIDQQRLELIGRPEAMRMASESALLGLSPEEFKLVAIHNTIADENETSDAKRPKQQKVTATPRLVNRAREVGVNFQWYKDVEIQLESIPIHESLGGGIAALDYDLDGWPDLYLCQGSGDPPTDKATRSNELYRNLAGKFEQVTIAAMVEDRNYSSGLAAGDVNQDGFADLYLGSLGHNRMLINNGDGTFRDATGLLGDCGDRFTSSVAIADISGDHLPDLFEANYVEMDGGFSLPMPNANGILDVPSPLSHYADSDRWFENLGDGQFLMHSISREIAVPATSLGLVITDFNTDGANEVFVGNDLRPNHLLIQDTDSDGAHHFVNVADSLGLANGFNGVSNGCMGIATGDFNRDGRLDLQIANYSMDSANLFLQTSGGAFIDQCRRYGLFDPTYPNVGFGTKAVDIDRNGFLDFIVANGHIFDLRHVGEAYQMAPQLLMSDGQQYRLTQVEDESGYWDSQYLGRAVTMLDYDRDGAIDFAVGHLDQPVAILHNETRAGGGWLQLDLIGTHSERDAIGARVSLSIGEATFVEWVIAGDGYFCSDESFLVFAFEQRDPLGQIEVQWPSGLRQTFTGIQRDRRYLLIESDPTAHLRQ